GCGRRGASATTALAVTLDDRLMRDAEGVANPRPGHTVSAGVGDGDLDRLLQHGAEHAEVMETGLGVGEGRIAQTPVERLDVIEGSGVRAHQRPPPITEATAARWRGVSGVRARRSPARRPAARAAAMTGSSPSACGTGVASWSRQGRSSADARNVDNDRHRKSSDMSIFRFPATVIGLFDRLLIREQNPALLSRGPGGIFLSATILPR